MGVTYLFELETLRALLRKSSGDVPGSWEDESDRKDFFNIVTQVAQDQHSFQTMLAVYPFVIVSRFFKAFSFQPRMALVTETLRQAGQDILHFGIVFGSVFVVYTVSAMMLFGEQLSQFANFGRAFTNVFL